MALRLRPIQNYEAVYTDIEAPPKRKRVASNIIQTIIDNRKAATIKNNNRYADAELERQLTPPKKGSHRTKIKQPTPTEEAKATALVNKIRDSLEINGGLLATTARELKIPTHKLYDIVRQDKELKYFVQDVRSEFVDQAEKGLRALVAKGNIGAIMFTLKCLAQDRGYVDVPKLNKDTEAPIIIKFMPADASVKMPMLPKAVIVDDVDSQVEVIDSEVEDA